MKDKTKMYGMVLGVVLFILLIAGFTYAALNWESVKTNIGINTNMMLVALSSYKDDKLKLRHGGALSAYYITNEKIKYLLMPVRLV